MEAAQKRGQEELGRSQGGLTTKVHAVVDGLGNPLWILLSPGNRNDICYAQKLLESFDLRRKFVVADRGYDSDQFVHWLEERGVNVVIQSRTIAKHPCNIDWHIYKERHLVENLFLKIKVHCRFSTGYKKHACLFFSVTLLASILLWIA